MTLVLIGLSLPYVKGLLRISRRSPGCRSSRLRREPMISSPPSIELDPEAVLIDIQQPQAGGLRLIEAIRALKSGSSPVIIALSSPASVQYRMKCHEAGATFFFDTANDQESLLSAVRSIGRETNYHAWKETTMNGRRYRQLAVFITALIVHCRGCCRLKTSGWGSSCRSRATRLPWDKACGEGIQLAVDEINKRSGVNGRRIDIDVQDSKGDPQAAIDAFNRIESFPSATFLPVVPEQRGNRPGSPCR